MFEENAVCMCGDPDCTIWLSHGYGDDSFLTTLRAENRLLREVLQSIKADCEADYPPSHGAIKYACIDALAQVAK